MTFDEAIEQTLFDSFEDTYNYDVVYAEDVVGLLKKLRQEYAPTVEMTLEQARVFTLYYDSKKPFDKSDFEYPDNLFMKSVNEKDLMQAWLHPETIKVVNDEKD